MLCEVAAADATVVSRLPQRLMLQEKLERCRRNANLDHELDTERATARLLLYLPMVSEVWAHSTPLERRGKLSCRIR